MAQDSYTTARLRPPCFCASWWERSTRPARRSPLGNLLLWGGNAALLGQAWIRFVGPGFVAVRQASPPQSTGRGVQLWMFLGNDGGILGVGAPEIVGGLSVAGLVGRLIWFCTVLQWRNR